MIERSHLTFYLLVMINNKDEFLDLLHFMYHILEYESLMYQYSQAKEQLLNLIALIEDDSFLLASNLKERYLIKEFKEIHNL